MEWGVSSMETHTHITILSSVHKHAQSMVIASTHWLTERIGRRSVWQQGTHHRRKDEIHGRVKDQ